MYKKRAGRRGWGRPRRAEARAGGHRSGRARSSAAWRIALVEFTQHTITLPGLPISADGLRVVQLTDIHRSRLTHDRILRHAVALANTERPDLIVLTGDFVTNRPSDIEPCA